MSSSIYVPNFMFSILKNPVIATALPLGLGMLSGFPTAKVNLRFPPGRPPRQLFPILWPLLYVSMGYASHIAVKAFDISMSSSDRSDLALGIALYYAQLSMNIAWTPLFFGYKKVGIALIDCLALAGTTVYATKLLHGPTNTQATYFLVPYCAWLCFANYLNGGIWWLNKNRSIANKD
ncbi:hypothetical protein D9757_002731 [Collybiopsis confluens]|uniref:TspO/MBR-related protein n=1 Tax=Collybiopsis confluens TaxID=2823264 RepID=A0A8H5HWQ0_9AGAR|nr:hypothetical protein D9757_002731 [Collybiopsis confluens]